MPDALPRRPIDVRSGLAPEAITAALIDNLHYRLAKLPQHATPNDWYRALAYTIRDCMLDRYLTTLGAIADPANRAKVVAYLSAEFLTGPHLGNGLICLGIWDATRTAVARVGQDLPALLEAGGRARAGQRRPRATGGVLHGLARHARHAGHRLRHSLRVRDLRSGDSRRLAGRGHGQVAPLRQSLGNRAARNQLRGGVRRTHRARASTSTGGYRVRWLPERVVKGVAYDTPVPGYRVGRRNLLRLWKAEAVESFDFEAFNVGDYYRAVDQKVASETI